MWVFSDLRPRNRLEARQPKILPWRSVAARFLCSNPGAQLYVYACGFPFGLSRGAAPTRPPATWGLPYTECKQGQAGPINTIDRQKNYHADVKICLVSRKKHTTCLWTQIHLHSLKCTPPHKWNNTWNAYAWPLSMRKIPGKTHLGIVFIKILDFAVIFSYWMLVNKPSAWELFQCIWPGSYGRGKPTE